MSRFDVTKADIIPTVTVVDVATQDHSPTDPQFPGLHCDSAWLWAMLDTEDGSRYQVIRWVSASSTCDYTIHECHPDIWTHPRHVRVPGEGESLYWGPVLWIDRGGVHTMYPLNMSISAAHPLRIGLSTSRYRWRDDDLLDLVLTPIPDNVTRIDVPGKPDPVGYISSGATVSGTVEGKAIVGGYGGLDRMYTLPGLGAAVSKTAHLEHYWFVWAAEMPDGTIETGNCMLGAGGYATATFRRAGHPPVIATNDEVKATVVWSERDGVSQPHLATLNFGGETFNFTGTHNAAAAAASLGIAWLHGTVQRDGGPASVRSWSTMEVIQKGVAEPRGAESRAKPRNDI